MISSIDHFVITTKDIKKSIEFYKILGFTATKERGRYNLYDDTFKINLHPAENNIYPVAKNPQVGSVDICFRATKPLSEVKEYLKSHDIKIELDEVRRQGFYGPMTSIYIRDPDGNLIEISRYI